MPEPNPYLLAADNSPALLPLLREKPELAGGQDDSGYSLVHAAASYNHLELLRALIREFNVNVNITDEDGETALFVVETVEAAKCLAEELKADLHIRGSDELTAREKIEAEGEYPAVAAYLASLEGETTRNGGGPAVNGDSGSSGETAAPPAELPALPDGLAVSVGTMDAPGDVLDEVDPEFRRRIEQLAEREDFHTPEGQAELRRLVEDVVSGQEIAAERNVRSREG